MGSDSEPTAAVDRAQDDATLMGILGVWLVFQAAALPAVVWTVRRLRGHGG